MKDSGVVGNYETEGLSLQEVASHVHISPIYFSFLFKKEKSITFSDFLLNTRMKSAVELLRMSGLKSYEVAEQVGYSNRNISVNVLKNIRVSLLASIRIVSIEGKKHEKEGIYRINRWIPLMLHSPT